MKIECPKCTNEDNAVIFKKKFDNIKRDTYINLSPEIKQFMNNDSRGDTVEVYKEFLLYKCKRCEAMFFKDVADSEKDKR